MHLRVLVSVLAITVMLTGCTKPPSADPSAKSGADPTTSAPAVDRRALLGRWTPVALPSSFLRRRTLPFLHFAADGAWDGSDGCNYQNGRWSIDANGTFAATGGVSTLIGCNNVEVGHWLVDTRTVEINGDVLTLRDANKALVGELRRATSQ